MSSHKIVGRIMPMMVRRTIPQIPVLDLDDARSVARFFQVLADPTRVRMIKALADGEWCVSELTHALKMDQPAVSHQLKYLRELGIVRSNKSGRHVYYTLADSHVRETLLMSITRLECSV